MINGRVRGKTASDSFFHKITSVKFWEIDKTRIHHLTTGTDIWYIYNELFYSNFAGFLVAECGERTTVICAKQDKEGSTWQVN